MISEKQSMTSTSFKGKPVPTLQKQKTKITDKSCITNVTVTASTMEERTQLFLQRKEERLASLKSELDKALTFAP